jgi:hypothetical protein
MGSGEGLSFAAVCPAQPAVVHKIPVISRMHNGRSHEGWRIFISRFSCGNVISNNSLREPYKKAFPFRFETERELNLII